MKKKFLAFLLVAIVSVAMFPMTVFANGAGMPEFVFDAELGEYDTSKGTVDLLFEGMSFKINNVCPAEGYSLTNIKIKNKFTEEMASDIQVNYSMGSYVFQMPAYSVLVYPIFEKNEETRTIDISYEGNINLSLINQQEGITVQNKQDNKGVIVTIEANKTIPNDIGFNVTQPDKTTIEVIDAPTNYEPDLNEAFVLRLIDLPKYFKEESISKYTLKIKASTSSAAESVFNKITTDGKLKINSIKFDEDILSDSNLMDKIFQDYLAIHEFDDSVNAHYIDKNHIAILAGNNKYYYNVDLSFEETNQNIIKKVEEIAEKLKNEVEKNNDPEYGFVKLFEVSDLEMVSFLFDEKNNPTKNCLYDGFFYMDTGSIKYSSEFNELIDYGNIEITTDNNNFSESPFVGSGFGRVYMYCNGVCYKAFNYNIGPEGKNVIYVPDDTPGDVNSYIAAAKKRIEDYLGKEVTITQKGTLQFLNNDFTYETFHQNVNQKTMDKIDGGFTKMQNAYYTIKVGDREFYFLIARDSSKMKTPIVLSKDLNTGASVETDSSEVPLDSTMRISEIGEGTEEYNRIVSKLGLTDGDIYDIDLHSNVTGTNIKKINNGLFEVRIPLKNVKYDKKNLKAYYVRDDGTVEIHDVVLQGGNAYFTTDHFSTYTIGEEVEIPDSKTDSPKTNNPETADSNNYIVWMILVGISIILGITCVVVYKKREN